jgi:hypothetical protein
MGWTKSLAIILALGAGSGLSAQWDEITNKAAIRPQPDRVITEQPTDEAL